MTEQQHLSPKDTAGPASGHDRVLIIDDDSLFRKVLARQLNKLGIEHIAFACNGQQAIEQIENQSTDFNLLFCDLNMPEMDGISFLRCLTQTHFDGGLVIVSGAPERIISSVKRLALAHKLGLLGMLEKPVNLSQLEQLITNRKNQSSTTSFNAPSLLNPAQLQEGLHRNAVELFYQPQLKMCDGSVIGAEALLRWRSPQGQLLSPAAVVPAAEKYGLMDQLTEAVLQRAISQLSIWKKQRLELTLSVNLSMDNLQNPAFFDRVNNLLKDANIAPQSLVLEITESRLPVDMRAPLELMSRFKLNNYRLSIDDFGTGYSTLEQLQGFPFDELKIDRRFVGLALSDESAMPIIEASIALARSLSMQVVAEGIENIDEWRLMKDKGCDLAQGFLMSPPLPANELFEWQQQHHWQE